MSWRQVRRRFLLSYAPYSPLLDKVNSFGLYRQTFKDMAVPAFQSRQDLYCHVHSLISHLPFAYLEFGVANGLSLRYWVDLERNPDSRFYGFDTFYGLPEKWTARFGRGSFSRGGRPIAIEDSRIELIQGLFQETLPIFLQRADFGTRQLVVHLDADLYSSTLYCLTQLDCILGPGSIVIFDEFQSVQHEFRAFYDYVRSYYRTWELISVANDGIHCALRLGGRQLRMDETERAEGIGSG